MADAQHQGVDHIDESQFESAVLKSDKPVMVDFYADWCGPCKLAAPILDDLSEEQDGVKIVKLNVDENPELPRKYGVMSIPTIILFNKGEEADRLVGFAGRSGYEKMIEKATSA